MMATELETLKAELDHIREALCIAAGWARNKVGCDNARTKIKRGLDAQRAVKAALSALPLLEGWKPIETAPKADFVRALPSGMDDATYQQIEDALDRIEAPMRDASGRWLTLAERVAASAGLAERLNRLATYYDARAEQCAQHSAIPSIAAIHQDTAEQIRAAIASPTLTTSGGEELGSLGPAALHAAVGAVPEPANRPAEDAFPYRMALSDLVMLNAQEEIGCVPAPTKERWAKAWAEAAELVRNEP